MTAWFVALSLGSALIASRTSASDSDGSASSGPSAAELGARKAADRLAWIVALADPITTGSTSTCLELGAACDPATMLDVDTTRLRAASLAASLTDAVAPTSGGYLGPFSGPTTALAERTTATASGVADQLTRWLGSGCGSTVDGMPVGAHPPECADLAATARHGLDALVALLGQWPKP